VLGVAVAQASHRDPCQLVEAERPVGHSETVSVLRRAHGDATRVLDGQGGRVLTVRIYDEDPR
jgi:hypothetical protein